MFCQVPPNGSTTISSVLVPSEYLYTSMSSSAVPMKRIPYLEPSIRSISDIFSLVTLALPILSPRMRYTSIPIECSSSSLLSPSTLALSSSSSSMPVMFCTHVGDRLSLTHFRIKPLSSLSVILIVCFMLHQDNPFYFLEPFFASSLNTRFTASLMKSSTDL